MKRMALLFGKKHEQTISIKADDFYDVTFHKSNGTDKDVSLINIELGELQIPM